MPRAKTNKLYRTFVKGLITEAGYLTYPEDSSVDELNTVLSRKGNRTRRLGVDYEEGFNLLGMGAGEHLASVEAVWNAVDNISDLNFLVMQNGTRLHFFELNTDPISQSKKSFVINLKTYKIGSATNEDIYANPVQISNGFGLLFVVHPYMDPICIEYNERTETIVVTRVRIQIRDFEGVYDGLANDQEPRTITKTHRYNLMNQGWVNPGTIGSNGSGGSGTYYDPYTGSIGGYGRNQDMNQV